MIRNFLLVLICTAFAVACSSNQTANSNNSANASQEFSNNSINPSGSPTPGIPDPNSMNANNVPKGATPTPGIPDPKDIGKPLPKGATPTPGIPDPETLKKQSQTVIKDMNLVNNPSNANRNPIEKPRVDQKKPGSQK